MTTYYVAEFHCGQGREAPRPEGGGVEIELPSSLENIRSGKKLTQNMVLDAE